MNPRNYHIGFAITLVVVLLGFALKAPAPGALRQKTAPPNPAKPNRPVQNRVAEAYEKLPLSFEANRGQTDPQVKFLARGHGYKLFLTSTEAVLALQRSQRRAGDRSPKARMVEKLLPHHRPQSSAVHGLLFQYGIAPSRDFPALFPSAGRRSVAQTEFANGLEPKKPSVLRMKLVGANPSPAVTGLEQLLGRSNYFTGKDPKKWRTNVPTYAKVKYDNVYPGVGLVYYGSQGQLEYDFVVDPGADPRLIRLSFDGLAEANGRSPLQIDSAGDLVVSAGRDEIRFHKPIVYQPLSSNRKSKTPNRKSLDGNYVLGGKNEVTFEIASYDKTRPLVIDPVLRYSTYLGGSGDDLISPVGVQGITVDPEGNAYVIGVTDSTDFPATAGAFQTKLAGGESGTVCGIAGDAFVTKVTPRGDAIVYSTYLGGSSDDCGEGIAVDSAGNAYLAGETLSTDFPVTAGVFQPACNSCSIGAPDTFAAKLSRDGSTLVYSTYIGGSDADLFPMIAIDRDGNTYIEGTTFSTDFPTTPGAFQPACASCANGAPDTYVTKLNPEGTALVYSTYLGGSDFEDVCGSQIAVDSGGSAYVNGFTCSDDFPTHNPLQAAPAGGCDAFLTKINPAGNALVYSTYLGGSDFEFILGTTIDSARNAYVSGFTLSSDFPTTPGAFQTSFSGVPADAFVTKINPSGTALVYSTYLGGTGDDASAAIVIDSDGNAYIGGNTSSTDFPTLNPFQPANAGGFDIFVTELNPAGSALVYSTYLGGSSDEGTSGMEIDSRRNIYLEGTTMSNDFLAVNPVQPQFGGGTFDGLVAKISPIDAPGLGLSRLSVGFPAPPPGTTSPPQIVTVHSVGSQPLVISKILTAPSSQFAQTNTCTQALAPGESCTISITFTAKNGGQTEAVLAVVANSTPASGQVRLIVTDRVPSVSAQRATANRPGQASPARPNGALSDWRTAIIRRRTAR